jgi:hypothetical protein
VELTEMKTLLAAIVLILALSTTASAKDHSGDYKMGKLEKVPLHVGGKVTAGFTDTTTCNEGLLGVHCTGGIVDDYSGWLVADMPDGTELTIKTCTGGEGLAAVILPCDQPYVLMLTEEDGTPVFLDHTWGHHDSAKGLEATSKILYRIEHHMGITYVMIPDPTDVKKEGSYNPIKLPKPLKVASKPAADSNISAMCASGKLSEEAKAKYCK